MEDSRYPEDAAAALLIQLIDGMEIRERCGKREGMSGEADVR